MRYCCPLQFVTEGHVLLLALKVAGLNSLEDDPGTNPAERRKWLHRVATQVVDRCWLPPSSEDVATVMDAMKPGGTGDVYAYCFCREGMYTLTFAILM